MNSSDEHDLDLQVSRTTWRPVPPPTMGEPLAPFYISILLPGLSTAFLQTVLSRSYNTIRKYQAQARQAESDDPSIYRGVKELMAALTPSDGLAMAQARGRCQLPFWSRMAIVEYRKVGYSVPAIAEAFRCSQRTVAYVLRRSSFLEARRRLASQQLNPSGRF